MSFNIRVANWAGRVAQVVERLPSKHRAPEFNPYYHGGKKKGKPHMVAQTYNPTSIRETEAGGL
jgi:hypothetical protein